jgi:hypothetical protein
MATFNLDTDFNRFAGKEVDVIETFENTKYGRVSSMRVVDPSPVSTNCARLSRKRASACACGCRVWPAPPTTAPTASTSM